MHHLIVHDTTGIREIWVLLQYCMILAFARQSAFADLRSQVAVVLTDAGTEARTLTVTRCEILH